MEVGAAPLTVALELIRAQVITGFGLIQGDVTTIYNALLKLSVVSALALWVADGRSARTGVFCIRLFGFAALASVVGNFQYLIETLYQMVVAMGLKAGGSSFAALDFFDPGKVAVYGLTAVKTLREHIHSLLGWAEFIYNLPEIIIYLAVMIFIIACFVIMGLQVFVTVLEFLILSLACFIVAPFAVWNNTSFLAERAMGYTVGTAVKLLVLALIFAVSSSVLMGWRWSEEPAIDEALGIMALSIAIFLLTLKAPQAAAGMINGGPTFSFSDAMSSLVNAARVSNSIGGTVTSALGGAAAMTGAAMQANMAAMAGIGGGPGGGRGGRIPGQGPAGGGGSPPLPTSGSGGGANSFARGLAAHRSQASGATP